MFLYSWIYGILFLALSFAVLYLLYTPPLSVKTAAWPEVPGLYPLLSLTPPAGADCSSLLGRELVDWYPMPPDGMNCLMYYPEGGHASKDCGKVFGI